MCIKREATSRPKRVGQTMMNSRRVLCALFILLAAHEAALENGRSAAADRRTDRVSATQCAHRAEQFANYRALCPPACTNTTVCSSNGRCECHYACGVVCVDINSGKLSDFSYWHFIAELLASSQPLWLQSQQTAASNRNDESKRFRLAERSTLSRTSKQLHDLSVLYCFQVRICGHWTFSFHGIRVDLRRKQTIQ